MSWTPPPPPPWLVRMNRLAAAAGGAEHLVGLDPDALIAEAIATTGHDDFGADDFRTPLRVLLEAAEREAALTVAGRLITRTEVLRLLRNRLRLVAWQRAEPAAAAAPVEAPIVIVGTARSGTSILHELLACDPDSRTPATWEVMYSTPPPEAATYASDPRIAVADAEVTWWHDLAPSYVAMHENGGRHPQECIFLMAHAFQSNHFAGVLDVPTYTRWMAASDMGPAYRIHRALLQCLQSRHRLARWVLKAPSHLGTLAALFAVYPDARIVLTHRDPKKTLPSTISLLATLRAMRSDRVDVPAIARGTAAGVATLLERMIAMRADGRLPESQFIDVAYADLMSRPLETLAALYPRLGLDLTPAARERMTAHLTARPRGQHGPHRYDLADFGFTAAEVDRLYAPYLTRFAIAPEG